MTAPAHRLQTMAREARLACFFWRRVDGTAALEFGLLAPVFLLMFLGILELGRVLWTQSALQNAAEAAARYAAINYATCASSSQTQSFAAGEMFGQRVPNSTFSLSCNTCGTQVSATLPFSFVAPGLLPHSSVTLTVQSCHPV